MGARKKTGGVKIQVHLPEHLASWVEEVCRMSDTNVSRCVRHHRVAGKHPALPDREAKVRMPTLVEDKEAGAAIFAVYDGKGRHVGTVGPDSTKTWYYCSMNGRTLSGNAPTLAHAIEVLTGVFPESGVMVK